MGVYQQAEGSAYIEQGNTKILCAVYGPHEGKRSWQLEDRAVINCQYSSVTFSGLERKNRPRGDRKSNECARLLEKAFESAILTDLYPRSQIDIFCEVIQADGSQLAACVNATSLALADAGIPMKGLLSAVTCTMFEGVPVVDIMSREENDILPRLTIATLSGKDEVVLIELQNRVHVDHLTPLMCEAKEVTANVHECLHAAIRGMLKSLRLVRRLSFCGRLCLSSQPLSSVDISEAEKWTDFVKTIQIDVSPARLQSFKEHGKEDRVFELIDNKLYNPDDLIAILQNCLDSRGNEGSLAILEKVSPFEQIQALPSDYCLDVLMYLVKLKLEDGALYKHMCQKLENISNSLNPGKLVICISEAKKRQISLPNELEKIFYEEITKQIRFNIALARHLKVSEVLAAFNHLTFSSAQVNNLVQHSKSLLNIMSCNEAIALFRNLSNRGIRDNELLHSISKKIVTNNDPLSLNQVVSLAYAASKLKIGNARLWRKIVTDLQTSVIHMTWNDATALIESFRKRRLADREIWDCLGKWINTHIQDMEQQSVKAVTIVAHAFVNLGIETNEIILVLLKAVNKPKARELVSSPRDWLNAVHTLAMSDSLSQEIGETVLGKEFIDELLKKSTTIYQKLSNARKLLQVQTCLLLKYGSAYKGPVISKSTFGTLLTTKEAIEAIQLEKYGVNISTVHREFFERGLNILLPKSHIDGARVDERGYLWDAAVALDENNRFVPKNLWTNETVLRPIIIFDWKQIKENLHLSTNRPTESSLFGEDRTMLKHLRSAGLKPVIVFMADINLCASQEDKNRFLKNLFQNGVQHLPDIGLITMNRVLIRDISFGRLMETYRKIEGEEDLFAAFDTDVKPNEFLIFDLSFFDMPFRLNFRLRRMGADRSYSAWSPLFQSEIPACSRLLLEIPKAQIRIYNSHNFHLFLFDFLDIARRPAISCPICLDENNFDKFVSYDCGHGMCTLCEERCSLSTCCICTRTKNWTVSVRRRESGCPIDNCVTQTEEYVFYPCGCTISHRFEDPTCLVNTCCPYELCSKRIKDVAKIYINNGSSNLED